MHQLIFILNQIFTVCKIVFLSFTFASNPISAKVAHRWLKSFWRAHSTALFFPLPPLALLPSSSCSSLQYLPALVLTFVILRARDCTFFIYTTKFVCTQKVFPTSVRTHTHTHFFLRIYTSQQSFYRFLPADIGINEVCTSVWSFFSSSPPTHNQHQYPSRRFILTKKKWFLHAISFKIFVKCKKMPKENGWKVIAHKMSNWERRVLRTHKVRKLTI